MYILVQSVVMDRASKGLDPITGLEMTEDDINSCEIVHYGGLEHEKQELDVFVPKRWIH